MPQYKALSILTKRLYYLFTMVVIRGKLLLFLQLSAITITALFHNNTAQDLNISMHRISVKPLWWNPPVGTQDTQAPIGDNGTQPCYLEERNTSQHGQEMGLFSLHGSAQYTCSVLVNVSLGYHTRLEILHSDFANESFSLYINRMGDLSVCRNQYVLITNPTCGTLLFYDSLLMSLQGSVSILVTMVTGISVSVESELVCAEDSDADNLPISQVNHTEACNNVKGCKNRITCSRYGVCDFEVPNTCMNATLGYKEVTYQCDEDMVPMAKTSLILYSINSSAVDMVDLRFNNIVQMEGRPFQGLNTITDLKLAYNSLSTLHEGVFIGLSSLAGLCIDANELVELDKGSFKGLAMLRYLDLYSNRLSTLPVGIFAEVPSLETLVLSYNKIVNLNESTFDRLTELRYLDLNRNSLVSLPAGLLLSCALERLKLMGNKLSILPNGIFNKNNLEELDLSYNQIQTLHKDVFNMFCYQNTLHYLTLKLRHNRIEILPNGVFNALDCVDILYLDKNHLIVLPDCAFNEMNILESLFLSYNRLTILPNGIFNQLISLEHLELSYNRLDILPNGIFNESVSLRFLLINNNQLETLPDNVFNASNKLEQIYLQSNQMTGLSHNLVSGLSNLDTFYFSNNQLVSLSNDVFIGLILSNLALNNNSLVRLDTYIFNGLVTLKYVYIRDNRLRHINMDIFNDTIYVDTINLSGNQLIQCPNIRHLFKLKQLDI